MKRNGTHIRVDWIPKMDGLPGSSFRLMYRLHGGDGNWTNTTAVHNSNFTIVTNLLDEKAYDLAVVSIDGDFEAQSDVEIVKTAGYRKFISE